MKRKPVLTMPEYIRLFRIIAAVLDCVEANTERACLFFAITGAYLIEHAHKRPARPVAGAAFYRVDDETGFTIAFGRLEENEPICDLNAFHCWIECDGTIVDLMAPIFHESVASAGRPESVTRKSFQKPISRMSDSPYSLMQEGDFFLHRDPVLTMELIQTFLRKPGNSDLVKVCEHWYRRPPKPIQPMIQMGSNDGSVTTIRLSNIEPEGAW